MASRPQEPVKKPSTAEATETAEKNATVGFITHLPSLA